jgi:hypothetical protein
MELAITNIPLFVGFSLMARFIIECFIVGSDNGIRNAL